MAYDRTKSLLAKHRVTPDDVREIIDSFADETEEAEPDAVNAIGAARLVADDLLSLNDP